MIVYTNWFGFSSQRGFGSGLTRLRNRRSLSENMRSCLSNAKIYTVDFIGVGWAIGDGLASSSGNPRDWRRVASVIARTLKFRALHDRLVFLVSRNDFVRN